MVNAKLIEEQKFVIVLSCRRKFRGSRYCAFDSARRPDPTAAPRCSNRRKSISLRQIFDQRVARTTSESA